MARLVGLWDRHPGDMGCHIIDMPFWFLELKHPTRVEADSEGNTPLSAPTALTVRYHFPAGRYSDALEFGWYDGGRMPDAEVLAESGMTSEKVAGTFDLVMVGEKGKMFFNLSNLDWLITPASVLEDFKTPAALSCFENFGPFTETVLLGNLAIRLGEPAHLPAGGTSPLNCGIPVVEVDEVDLGPLSVGQGRKSLDTLDDERMRDLGDVTAWQFVRVKNVPSR